MAGHGAMGVLPHAIACLPSAPPRLVGSWLSGIARRCRLRWPMIFRALIKLRSVWLSPRVVHWIHTPLSGWYQIDLHVDFSEKPEGVGVGVPRTPDRRFHLPSPALPTHNGVTLDWIASRDRHV